MADKIGLKDFNRYNGNPRDFGLWKARFEGALDELDLFDVATGADTRPGTAGAAQDAWDKKNRRLYQLVLKALDDTTAQRVQADVADRDGVSAWGRTNQIVMGNTTLTLNMVLLELLQLRCADDGDVTEHVTEQKLLQARLTAAGRGLTEEVLKVVTLAGLPPRLKAFRDAHLDAKTHAGTPITISGLVHQRATSSLGKLAPC